MKQDIYVSIDIEADGPIPGLNSMLSLGAAAFYAGSREPVSTFEINIEPLEEATPDPDTMAWWASKPPEIWRHATKSPVDPTVAMMNLTMWVRSLQGNPVMVVFPTWDYMWLQYYMVRYLGPKGTPFGLGALDIKSLTFGLVPEIQGFKDTAKSKLPKALLEGCPPHTHKALEDAIGQGVWLVNMLALRNPAQ